MNILVLSLISLGLYTIGTLQQTLIYLRKTRNKPFISLLIGGSAVCFHFFIAQNLIFSDNKLLLSFFNTASLVACVIISGLLIFSARKPLQSIFIFSYPIAAICLAGSLLSNNHTLSYQPESSGIFIHIILSVLAYSVLCIAAIQALLVYFQNNNLKKRNQTILMRNLPPLLTMEKMLFEMLWSGTLLLTAAITTGLIFVEDFFAQHLVHKSVLSLIALIIFATLLTGRQVYGWRGMLASKWTLWGFSFLVVGFFGSKFVMEQIFPNS